MSAQSLNGHQVLGTLYESEHAAILRATHRDDSRRICLKVLRPEHPSPARLARFKSEFDLLAGVHLPAAPRVVALEGPPDRPCMVLEDLPGRSLADVVRDGRHSQEQLLDLAILIVRGLRDLHDAAICYLNLTPHTVFQDQESGAVLFVDFGLAINSASAEGLPADHPPEGNPAYVSPEQTGRCNSRPDHRSDFYSLGILLYEVCTGRRHYVIEDPIKMTRAHVTLPPAPSDRIMGEIPAALSVIIFRLLAREPENRYQTCAGLLADLEQARSARQAAASPDDAAGPAEEKPSLRLAEALFEQPVELNTLRAACQTIRGTSCRLLLVSGPAGSGKTTLIEQLHASVTDDGGVFLKAGFVRGQDSSLLSPLIDICRTLTRYLLTRGDEEVVGWRERITRELGRNGHALAVVIPELEPFVGPPRRNVPRSHEEAESRLHQALQGYLRACATEEHPLVIFLDDLQWSDATTCTLLGRMLTDASMRNLLFLGSSRDNDVDDSHCLAKLTSSLEELGVTMTKVRLDAVDLSRIGQFLASLLHGTGETVRDLARECLAKTSGNPFFLKQFLFSLHSAHHLFFDPVRQSWQWDIQAIRRMPVTDNVVVLIKQQLHDLPPDSLALLQHAACFAGPFSDEDLALVSGQELSHVRDIIIRALERGQLVSDRRHGLVPTRQASYRFSHDQIAKTVYQSLPERTRQECHLRIGLLLKEKRLLASSTSQLFAMAEELNRSAALILAPGERLDLARINLEAGRSARIATSYASACNYFQQGLRMLDAGSWQDEYTLAFSLHLECAEVACLAGRFGLMETLAGTLLQQTRSLLDEVSVYEILIQARKTQKRLREAVETGLHILRRLSVKLPARPGRLAMLLALLRIRVMLFRRSAEELVRLPKMTDPHVLATMRILEHIGTAAYYSVPELIPLIGFTAVRLSLRHGNCDQSTLVGYPICGFLLCGVLGDIAGGYNFGRLALDIQRRLHGGETYPQTGFLVANLISHWQEHLRDSLAPLHSAALSAQAIGQLEAAALATYAVGYRLFFLGRNLEEVKVELARYNKTIRRLGQETQLSRLSIFQQAVDDLTAHIDNPAVLNGSFCNSAELVQAHTRANDQTTLFVVYLVQAILHYLRGEQRDALDMANKARPCQRSAISSVFVPVYVFYDALIMLAGLNDQAPRERRGLLRRIRSCGNKMKKWARFAPMNYLNKYHLIEAELCRAQGLGPPAGEHYLQSAQLARDNGYQQEQALACELAAEAARQQGMEDKAATWLSEARVLYEQWGAVAKIRQLDRREPQAPS